MNLDILIGSDNDCKLKVKDITKESEYRTLFGVEFGKENSMAIDVLTYNRISGEEIKDYSFSDNSGDDIYLNIPEDGWITLSHIVLPTKEWIELNKNKFVDKPKDYYIYCMDNESVYRYLNGTFYEVTIDSIIQQNLYNTTISKVEKDYVSICYLRNCYINICQQVFKSLCGIGNCNDKVDKELSTKRDLVWMGINVIKYMVQFEMLEEAERIIERLISCHGICPQTKQSKSSGCGCSKA